MPYKVESFELDHNNVTAPYVRKAGSVKLEEYTNDKGDCATITKFDVRFAQPNKKFIPNDSLHSLEHMLAVYSRQFTDDIIDISPMGCRTGFYWIVSGDKSAKWAIDIVSQALEKVMKTDEVPGTLEESCGNYLEHDLDGAKIWAKRFLSVSKDDLENIYRK